MGSYKSKSIKVDIQNLPTLEPEPEYIVKTRPPMPSTWQLNLLRGSRENELNGLA